MNAIENLEKEHLRMDIPDFKAGDTIKVNFKIQEGDKERIQVFEGVVIRRRRVTPEAPSPCERSPMVSAWRGFSPCTHPILIR